MIDLFIAMAVHGRVEPKTMHSVLNLVGSGCLGVWRFEHHSSPNVFESRNQLGKRFLDTAAPLLLFADADNTFKPADVLALHEAMGDGVGLVGGNYVKRDGSNLPICSPRPSITAGELAVWTAQKKSVPAYAIPTGLMMVRREVFLKVPYPWFEPQYVGGKLRSSDVVFCQKVRDAGFATLAHLGVRAGHIGAKEYRIED